MKSPAQPHVSAAIRQLRSWVTLAALALALCCAVQMLVYGFAAYTDSRFIELREVKSDKPLRVVGAEAPVAAPAEGEPTALAAAPSGGVRGQLMDKPAAAVEINRVSAAADLWMRRASDSATSAGVIAALTLAILTMLGMIVAGGACVPGVERATTAAVWSVVLGLLCLPWGRIMPGLGVPGIFASYAELTGAIDARMIGGTTAGALAMGMQWVGAPLVAMFTGIGVCFWFRAGVEQGVIVTSASELDRAVEREVEMIQRRGVAATAPKAVGALNQAFGAGGSVAEPEGRCGAPAGTLSAVERALRESGSVGTATMQASEGSATRQRISRSVADGEFKRPI